jgi:hypothetical protein
MNPETSGSATSTIANSKPLHCQYRYASGRRSCRLPISDPDSGLCRKHAAERQKDLDQADLAASLIGDIEEFRSASDINHSLGELYKLQARNKITPRRAAVMAYTANLLLRTLPAIQLELDAEFGPPRLDLTGMPRPGDDGRRLIVDVPRPNDGAPRPYRGSHETSDTMAMIRKLHLAPPNATQPDDTPGEKLP